MNARKTLLLGLALLLSGCAEGGRIDVAPSTHVTETADGTLLAILSHEGPATVNTTRWLNGSFQAQEACEISGCATGSALREIDLSDGFPPSVPVRFIVDIGSATAVSPFQSQAMLVEFAGEDVQLYNLTQTSSPGHEILSGVLLRGSGAVKILVVYATAASDTDGTVEYTLRLDVMGHREWTPGGVPIEVHLGPGLDAVARTEGDDGTVAALFGPDDTLHSRIEGQNGEFLLQAAEEGDYVVVFEESVESVQIVSNSTGFLRALPISVTFSEPRAVMGTQAMTWSFDVDRAPLFVGFYERTDQPIAVTTGFSHVRISAPSGDVVDGTIGCGGCITGAYGAMVRTPTVDEGLVPGTYEVSYEPQPSAGLQVGHVVVQYER